MRPSDACGPESLGGCAAFNVADPSSRMRAIAVEEELGAGVKTVKERREATKSSGRVQAR
jgi:hypothetical protein